MGKISPLEDKIIFQPSDIGDFRLIQKDIGEKTKILATTNPGAIRLPNGNILQYVRVCEALCNPRKNGKIKSIRWTEGKFVVDKYRDDETVYSDDPRSFSIESTREKMNNYGLRLTSLSYILPVEMNSNGDKIEQIHFDKVLGPRKKGHEMGIEDVRVVKIDNKYYMTAVGVSRFRIGTYLFESDNGLDWDDGILIADDQNKDKILFDRKIKNLYMSLTRPQGSHGFASPEEESDKVTKIFIGGATSSNLRQWQPMEEVIAHPVKGTKITSGIGGGAPPYLTEEGWLIFYHGVEENNTDVGIYRTFTMLADREDPLNPRKIKFLEEPILEVNREIMRSVQGDYLGSEVVFTTGCLEGEKQGTIEIFSGQNDLLCRKSTFNLVDILSEF